METSGETVGFRGSQHATEGISQQNGSSPVRFAVDQIVNGCAAHSFH
jgi:hypothetical protein